MPFLPNSHIAAPALAFARQPLRCSLAAFR